MRNVPVTLVACLFILSTRAQQKLTEKDYQRAENFLGYNTQKYIDHTFSFPNWLPGDRFWYRTLTPQGSEFILVDPAKKTRTAAFNAPKLASAISSATGKTVTASNLPFNFFTYSDDNTSISFRANGQTWSAKLQDYSITKDTSGQINNAVGQRRGIKEDYGVVSPDGAKAAFIKDWNLWVRNVATGKETQLTTDGVKDFGYATDNAGWKHSDAPVLRWSPDSKKIATFKQDQR